MSTAKVVSDKRAFPWGLWALIGALGWVVLMFAVGTPIYALLAPAAGVVLGWAAGGVVFLFLSLLPRRAS